MQLVHTASSGVRFCRESRVRCRAELSALPWAVRTIDGGNDVGSPKRVNSAGRDSSDEGYALSRSNGWARSVRVG